MSVHEYFVPLTQIGRSIIDEQDAAAVSGLSRRQRSEAKKRLAVLEQKFREEAIIRIRAILLKSQGDSDPARTLDGIRAIFQQIRAAVQGDDEDASPRTRAVDLTAERVLGLYQTEAAKGPARRHWDRWWAVYVIATVASIYFGGRWYTQLPTYPQVETRAELLAGINAVEKVARYDDWANTRVRRGGWLMGIFLWPIEPTEEEFQFAVDTLSLVLDVHDYAQAEGLICGSNIPATQTDEAFESEVALVRHIESFAATSPEPQVPLLVLYATQDLFTCPQ